MVLARILVAMRREWTETIVVNKTETDNQTKEKVKMNFGKALEELKKGNRVCRSGWNGNKHKANSQFIELATKVSYMTIDGCLVNPCHDNYGNKAIAFVGTSGTQLGWLASQADMLAEDWQIIGDNVETVED